MITSDPAPATADARLTERRARRNRIVLAGLLILFGLWIVSGFIASLVWAAASGISGAAPAAYAADLAPKNAVGAAMGLYRTIADLGYVIGPLMLGTISDVISPQAALYFTAVLLLGSGTLFFVNAPETLSSRVKKPEPAET